jgi:hypothetical protein
MTLSIKINNMKYRLLFTLLSIFSFSIYSHSQVVINEYSASNLDVIKDSFNSTEDWLEIYNAGDAAVDLTGWRLSDKEDDLAKWTFPAGTQLDAKSFLTVFCSGKDGFFNDEYHTNFKLTQTEGNDVLVLSDPAGGNTDLVRLNLTLTEHSNCRSVDGGDTWVIATAPTFNSSNDNTAQALRYTQTPIIDKEAGFYSGSQTISISTAEPDVVIRYTVDGSNPLADSPIYVSPITISSTTVIKARAYSDNAQIIPGKMDFRTYLIDENYSLPVFSVAADRVTNLANGTGQLLPIGSIEYFKDGELVTTSFGELNRHGQDSWALDHRSIDWISRDEMGYSKAVNAPIFSTSNRGEYQRFMFRNSGDDNYPAIDGPDHEGSTHIRDEYVQTLAQEGNMKLDVRTVERVVVFLNGQYWGVYGMREKVVDHDYTNEYYDQGKEDLQFLSTWGTTEIEYGGPTALNEWIDLRNFILSNDMSVETNYDRAEDEIDLISLIDYFTMNQATVAIDWLNYNTGWWRGLNPDGSHKKWGYLLWDLDATFGYYINYTGVPDESPEADICDIFEISSSMDYFFGAPITACAAGENNTPYNDTDPILIQIVSAAPECCAEWSELCQSYYDDPSTIPLPDLTDCPSILNGSSPYAADDSIFIQVVVADVYCCELWDGLCESSYQLLAGGGNIDLSNCPIIVDELVPYSANDPILAQVVDFQTSCCDIWDPNCQDLYDFLVDNSSGNSSDFSDCNSIINGSNPYAPNDPKLAFVMDMNPGCCDEWGLSCERDYSLLGGDEFSEPDDPITTGITGNIGSHEKILLKLIDESPEFQQLYYSRYADLMNTVYSCENMNELLERMVAVIEPEMPKQIERWGGTMEEWESNLDDLRDFINARCLALQDNAVECYGDVEGQYSITLLTEPADVGQITFNTLNLDELPWSGDYFGNMDNFAEAKVQDAFRNQYVFSHWESKMGNNISPSTMDEKVTYRLSMPDTLIAHYELFDDGTVRGEVVINELMPSNVSTQQDQDGEYDDWIELYNRGSESIDLSGFFLTDRAQNLTKYAIPDNTILGADEYLIIWADEDDTQEGLHANFKLSRSGESVFLSDADSVIIDQITYTEFDSDNTFARRPNGSGPFEVSSPTFAENNNLAISTADLSAVQDKLIVYPNPANSNVTIQLKKNGHLLQNVQVRDMLGVVVLEYANLSAPQLIMNIDQLVSGMYIVTANGLYTSRIVKE